MILGASSNDLDWNSRGTTIAENGVKMCEVRLQGQTGIQIWMDSNDQAI